MSLLTEATPAKISSSMQLLKIQKPDPFFKILVQTKCCWLALPNPPPHNHPVHLLGCCAAGVLLLQQCVNQCWRPASPSQSPQVADHSGEEAGGRESLPAQPMVSCLRRREGVVRLQHGLARHCSQRTPALHRVHQLAGVGEEGLNTADKWRFVLCTKHKVSMSILVPFQNRNKQRPKIHLDGLEDLKEVFRSYSSNSLMQSCIQPSECL